jgi:NAD(P)-dependent dehydrogenase (short-subunit alcohol dehydrogenase family)
MTCGLCKEVGRHGIRVNALATGIIETDQTSELDEAGRARYAGLAALNRLGNPCGDRERRAFPGQRSGELRLRSYAERRRSHLTPS